MEGNYDAVRYYNILASQQRYSMDGKPLGLDYNAVRFVFDIYGVEKRLEIFEKLRVMERVAVEVRSAGG